MDDNNKDMYIKYKLSKIETNIPEDIDNLFNDFLKEEREDEKMEIRDGHENKIIFPKKISTIAAVLILCILLLGGANIYATTQGYDNLFFMIKYLVSENQEEYHTKEELLSDKDITISYMNIELSEDLQVQVNKLEIKNNTAKLTLKFTSTFPENKEGLKFKVYDEDTKEDVYFGKNEKINEYYDLILENYKDDIKKLRLEIEDNKNKTSTIIINLETKELEVLKGYVLDKLSETQLKEDLATFTFLNYCYIFDKKTKSNLEIYDNESLIISAYAYYLNLELAEEDKNVIYSYPNQMMLFNKNKIDEIIENVFGKKVDSSFEIGVDFETIEYKNEMYYHVICDYLFWPNGLVVEINDLTFTNGEYKATYSYCFPEGSDFEGETMDELPQFKSNISFKYNKNSEYRYKIIDFDRPELLSGTVTQISLDTEE